MSGRTGLPSAGRAPKSLLPDRSGASRLRAVDAADPTEIPLARRTVPHALQRRFSWRNALLGAGGVVLVAAGAALLLPQPMRRLLAPPPVQGLKARLSIDGRLLGHFPYAEAPDSALVSIAPGVQLQREAAEALQALQAAAAADGIEIRVLSAFRSIALQKQIFFDVKSERNQSALERAQVSAPPGFSEHSTGYAVDLGDGRSPGTNLSPSFDQTGAYRWLQDNANRFHFHLSFPQANRQGVSYEPWHWRFEGSAEALKMFEAAQRLER
jgi:D-alanyl-D-alanine carboxypeptidase